ncbi:MAG: hypothetical protein A2X61_04600 [Ignavibacteria bacterium GWB2_35_12]|nr:MAG: hypothetical protein A2X61_04600 [Ignavibacteria bacterium GWB2_35_12]OGU87183.1 MAG: hypothetical protein A2220_07865 [Ignavibacteria bacterium RIFOXYA2_FULL_35_10]OGV24584.1 MAG: hypothetical protein A2475_09190 [Ignavibacteria bacterium RIFOXYC2_FULL_35_21]
MKKYLISIVALFILCFTTNVYSDCPDGFTSVTFTVYTPISNCQYEVIYCYKCVMPAPQVGLIIDAFYKINPNCTESLGTDDLINFLETYLYEHFFSWGVCRNVPPPCNGLNDYIVLIMTYSKCWNKENDNGTIIYHNCHSYDCCQETHWCYQDGNPIPISVGIPYWCNQTENCSGSEPPNPEPGYSTDCFPISTPCSQ